MYPNPWKVRHKRLNKNLKNNFQEGINFNKKKVRSESKYPKSPKKIRPFPKFLQSFLKKFPTLDKIIFRKGNKSSLQHISQIMEFTKTCPLSRFQSCNLCHWKWWQTCIRKSCKNCKWQRFRTLRWSCFWSLRSWKRDQCMKKRKWSLLRCSTCWKFTER